MLLESQSLGKLHFYSPLSCAPGYITNYNQMLCGSREKRITSSFPNIERWPFGSRISTFFRLKHCPCQQTDRINVWHITDNLHCTHGLSSLK